MNDKNKAITAIIIASISISIAPTLVRITLDEGNSPTLIAAARLFFATLIMASVGKFNKSLNFNLERKIWIILSISGFFLAIHFATWMASVKYTTVAASTVLVTTSPLFVAIFGYFFLKDYLTIKQSAAIITGMVASIAIGLEGVNLTDTLSNEFLGGTYALIGAATVGVYITIGRQQRQSLTLTTYTTIVYGVAAFFLTIFVILGLFDSSLAELTRIDWIDVILMLLLAIFPSCLGHSMYNYALKELKGAIVSLSFLTEIIGSIILASILFNENPTLYFYSLAVVLIFSIVIVLFEEKDTEVEKNILP